MAKIITVTDLPDELLEQWLMHLRVFDRANPGCKFRIVADTGHALEEVRAIVANLDLPEIAVLRNKDTLN
jgi:hypothetical protein